MLSLQFMSYSEHYHEKKSENTFENVDKIVGKLERKNSAGVWKIQKKLEELSAIANVLGIVLFLAAELGSLS